MQTQNSHKIVFLQPKNEYFCRALGFKIKGGGKTLEETVNLLKNNKIKDGISLLSKRQQPFNNEEFDKSLYKYQQQQASQAKKIKKQFFDQDELLKYKQEIVVEQVAINQQQLSRSELAYFKSYNSKAQILTDNQANQQKQQKIIVHPEIPSEKDQQIQQDQIPDEQMHNDIILINEQVQQINQVEEIKVNPQVAIIEGQFLENPVEARYCYCNELYVEGDLMVECENKDCKLKWYHPRCLGMTQEQVDSIPVFYCQECCKINLKKQKKKITKKT